MEECQKCKLSSLTRVIKTVAALALLLTFLARVAHGHVYAIQLNLIDFTIDSWRANVDGCRKNDENTRCGHLDTNQSL